MPQTNQTNRQPLLGETAYLLSLEGRTEDALTVLAGFEELHPEASLVDLLRGGIETSRRDFLSAERSYRAGIQKDPDNEILEAHLAEALLLQKRFREGERLLSQLKKRATQPAALSHIEQLEEGIRTGEFLK